MADESIIISNLPTHTPAGSDYLAVEDNSVTGKATVNEVVAAAQAVQTNESAIGVLSSLTTSAKNNLVAAINEVDAHADTNATAISSLNSKTASLEAKFGGYLPANTNIDNWSTTGFWVYQREAPYSHTGTYPISDQYGTLICVRGTSDNFTMQMIRSNSTRRTDGTLYIRNRTAGTWGSWMKIVATAI